MSQVVVGGTFNVFHKGHAKLLDAAMTIATFRDAALIVGVTDTGFAQHSRRVPVRPYRSRLNDVQRFVEGSDLRPHFGPVMYTPIRSVDDMPKMDEYDVLVVSEETAPDAYRMTNDKGYRCYIHVVKMATDTEGDILNSTKILEEMR